MGHVHVIRHRRMPPLIGAAAMFFLWVREAPRRNCRREADLVSLNRLAMVDLHRV